MASDQQIESDVAIIETKLSDETKLKLIADLEEHPCLWNTGSSTYKSKQERLKASENLAAKHNIDAGSLKTLLHGLRTSLTREIRREQEGRPSKWKFFGAMSYMKEDIERSSKEKEVQVWIPEDVEKLIDFYKENEQLWKHNIQSYRDRNLRDINMQSLRDMFPERSVEDIKKQWQNLKTIFQREVKREEGSKVSGTGTSNVYVSAWKYFNSMMFLRGNDDIDPQLSTLVSEDDEKKPVKRSRRDLTPSKEMENTKVELYKEAIR